MDPTTTKEVARDIFPYVKVYKDGTIERLAGTEIAPPGLDSETGVFSEDIVIIPESGVSGRLYRPKSSPEIMEGKLPLVIYYHGGGFFLSSSADPKYHQSLNKIVAEAKNIVLLSVDYRLAPENPLPAAYEDAWASLQWVANLDKAAGSTHETWLKEHVDFNRVFLAGDSCGANMAHHITLKLNDSELGRQLKIQGIIMIYPYFWGKDPIGVEVTDITRKAMVDGWWMFVCPSEKGCDDPLINPFTNDHSPEFQGIVSKRVLVIVAEKDILKDRGKLYYEKLVNSGWEGNVELLEIKGEDHIFHIINPNCNNAKSLFMRLATFINESSP